MTPVYVGCGIAGAAVFISGAIAAMIIIKRKKKGEANGVNEGNHD